MKNQGRSQSKFINSEIIAFIGLVGIIALVFLNLIYLLLKPYL